MAGETANRITEADAHNLVDKLQAFEATLPPAEQALLCAALRRAAGVDEDRQGYLLLDQFLRGFVAGDRCLET